jgi:TATA-binding protein-associated factor
VRSVAASCLLPVAEHIVQRLPQSLEQILVVLWHCLCDMKDDLSSSVGVIMDLIGENLFSRSIFFFKFATLSAGKLVVYEQVIGILAKESVA